MKFLTKKQRLRNSTGSDPLYVNGRGWGWFSRANSFIFKHNICEGRYSKDKLIQLIALAMATEKHGFDVEYIDNEGTERTKGGYHLHGRGQGYYDG